MWSRVNVAARGAIRAALGSRRTVAVATTTVFTAGFAATAPANAAGKPSGEAAYVYAARAKPAAAAAKKVKVTTPAPPVRVLPHHPKPRVIFVLGGPGAGKGTQCAKLVEDYGFLHLSAGDLLRAERASGSPDGEMIERHILAGTIVPVEVTVRLIQKAMAAAGATKVLVDGFPRNFDNLQGWEGVMGGDGSAAASAVVDGVLFYDVPEDVMVQRLLVRGQNSGRSDDTAEVITKRLRTYVSSTMPVIDHYAAKGKVVRIDGSAPVTAVYANTVAAVTPTIQAEVADYTALLLESISAGDWDAYASLCAEDMTCAEPEAEGGVVTGLAFHKVHFDEAALARAQAIADGAPAPGPHTVSSMSDVNVRLLGPKHAVITYTRLISPSGGDSGSGSGEIKRMQETRVWEARPGVGGAAAGGWRWVQVHLHRSPLPPVPAPATK